MSTDPFIDSSDSLISPAKHVFSITPQANSELPTFIKALYVGTGGDVVLRAVESSTDVTLTNVASGTILPIRIRAIRSSSTAANFVGLA